MLSSFSRCFKTGFKDLSGRLSKPLTELLDPDPNPFLVFRLITESRNSLPLNFNPAHFLIG